MKHFPRKLARIAAVATAETDSFVALARRAGLDPAHAFRGANLSNVDFGTDSIVGFDFTGANLEGADLSRVTGHAAAILKGVSYDSGTKWPRVVHHFTAIGVTVGPPVVGTPMLQQDPPPDFSEAEVRRRILANEAIPDSWRPLVRRLDFSVDWRSFRLDHEAPRETLERLWDENNEHILRSTNALLQFTNLEELDVSGCPILNFPQISFLSKLKKINLSYSRFNSLIYFRHVSSILHISFSGTSITDLLPISYLPNLEVIDAGDTRIRDISILSSLPKLHTLNISRTLVTSISVVNKFPSLQVIYVMNTPIPNDHGIDPGKHVQIIGNDGMRWPWQPLRGPVPPGRRPPFR